MPVPDLEILYPNGQVEAVQMYVWSGGKPVAWDGVVTAQVSGADGAIQDGASAAIKATVRDYTNANPLAVVLTDANGDYIAAGAGTQYTEDAAAAADPIGGALVLVRKDTPASEVTTDGDNIAARGSSAGAQYVELLAGTAKIGIAAAPLQVSLANHAANATAVKVDGSAVTQPVSGTITANAGTNLNTSALALETGGNLATVKTNTDKIPALGQALAASSVPVVLTAAQISTLTPPAAITGFALESSLSSLNGKVTAVNTGAVVLAAGSAAIGKLAANSGVDIGDVDVTSLPALPAGTNLIGNVGHGLTPLWKTGSTNATFTLVAADATKKIKVYSISLMTLSATAITITFKDGAAGTALATYILQSPTSIVTGIAEGLPIGSALFTTTANTLLEMSFSAAVTVVYNVRYWIEA